jgi:hypothetical protein
VILPKDRDPRFITIRRGGTLTDSDHRLLAFWAAACAEHVLHLFESVQPSDARPREAIEQIRAWACGEIRMSQARAAGGHAMAAARELGGAARHAAYAAAPGCDSRTRPGRSAVAKRDLLVGLRLLTGLSVRCRLVEQALPGSGDVARVPPRPAGPRRQSRRSVAQRGTRASVWA